MDTSTVAEPLSPVRPKGVGIYGCAVLFQESVSR